MLNKIFTLKDNTSYKNAVKNFYNFVKHMTNEHYTLKLNNITYINNSYNIAVGISNQIQHTNYNINQVFYNKSLIELMSPIDAYLCGVVFSLEKNLLHCTEFDILLAYFKNYNNSQVMGSFINLMNIDLFNQIVTVQIGNIKKQMKYTDFICNPYLINGLQSYEAARLGVISMDYAIGEACLN